jgi:hypothetical protein
LPGFFSTGYADGLAASCPATLAKRWASASCSAPLRFGEIRQSRTAIRHILSLRRGYSRSVYVGERREEEIALVEDSYHRDRIANRQLHPETLMMGYGYAPGLSEGSLKPPIFLTSTLFSRTPSKPRWRWIECQSRGPIPALLLPKFRPSPARTPCFRRAIVRIAAIGPFRACERSASLQYARRRRGCPRGTRSLVTPTSRSGPTGELGRFRSSMRSNGVD